MTSQSRTQQEVTQLNMQQWLVLTAASGAVLMDLKTEKIANGWILLFWLLGFWSNLTEYRTAGISRFLTGAIVPLVCLFRLFYFGMLGAGDIKLLSVIGGFLGWASAVKCIVLSFVFGAILSIGILIVCGNIRQRLLKFTDYVKQYHMKILQREKRIPDSYRKKEWGMESVHFTVPVLLAVLLWIGGFY